MILLDTHVLLWIVTGQRRIGARATDSIRRADSVLASAISYVELEMKSRRRKLVVPPDFPRLVHEQGIQPLAFTEKHAAGLRAVPALDGHDPFDRMLLAQAQIEGHAFATADSVLLELGLPWVLDATA
ncbi:type II toxin-antitoxin system VapC family toxin [Nocardioides marmorisolisilvae]|uniref:PIN domain-containing protein n=1 Tax=Nocardioides marmorisolisilvae TaxID=1542737 RepID=A0A3N0DI68_9ACTN|nr:type II toxin-antitoxin system VapC family toxin [Nocardioides marmorisolisilvae]RNL75382.1 PIN domain-containing protein [Nocardioides marmorisolisilvae]